MIGSQAGAAILDFEGFEPGQIIDGEYAPDVFISARNLSLGPDVAVIFDTGEQNPAGQDFDLVAPFSSLHPGLDSHYRPGNVLIIQERNDCNFQTGFCITPDDEGSRPGGEFEIRFSVDVILGQIDFFDIEREENNGNSNSEIHLYDYSGDEIQAGMFYVPFTGGNNTWDQLDFAGVSGVRSVVIELNGSGAIDNLTYHVVPVPAAGWLFGSSIGLFGWLGKQRRHSVNR